MKYLSILLIPVLMLLACESSEVAAPMGEIAIIANIGPLYPVANATDTTPCGYSVEKLNEIYGNYTLKILTEKNGTKIEVYSTKLSYPAKVIKALPMGTYSIDVNNQTTTVNTDVEAFTISSTEKQILNLEIDTGIR